MSIPVRLIVEYDNGSKTGIEFSKINRKIQESLAALGLCPSPVAPATASKSYLLLRWQNGWQEIVGIDKSQVELLRYYTIERMEEVGRMSLKTEEVYPTLFFIKRLPRLVDSALLTDHTGSAMYTFSEKTTITEGGKTEHILYDKQNPKFTLEDKEKADSWVSELANSVKVELDKNGLTVEKFLSMNSDQKSTIYGDISKALGICAMEGQEDINGFIELMLRKNLA